AILLYGDQRGLLPLREDLAAEADLEADDVLLTAGAAMALFLVAVTVLGDGGHLVVVRPNYATNLETPFALGVPVTHLDLRFEEGYQLDLARVAAALRPDTRLISVTTPHNPTGVEMDSATLHGLVALAEAHGCHLLVDETYRDMAGSPVPIAASLSPRVLSVASVSKTYGVPGIRLGWVLCKDRALQARLLAAKEQVVLTGSVLDETVALHVRRRRREWLPGIRSHLASQRAIVDAWLATEPRIAWVPPTGGVVGFPRIVAPVDTDTFYAHLAEAGVHVGPGRWFDQDPHHFRLGWGWPTAEELRFGLATISAALDAAAR
ncbi:MAG: pyridoxal phosphate-dependent aminotransferase, partial [Pseudomonadota bacterium]|nr:pyridoxal phosphate-dependent aminotransferase [Pseudomonadota bacterium]